MRIALQRETVQTCTPICTEAGLKRVAAVRYGVAVGILAVLDVAALSVQANMTPVAERRAITDSTDLLSIACARGDQNSLRVACGARDDVDDTVDGIDTPQ